MATPNLVLVRLENGLTAHVGVSLAKSHNLEVIDDEQATTAAPAAKARKRAAQPRKRAEPKTSTASAEDSNTTGSQGSESASSQEENQ